jgi:hypothetical protein
MSLGLSPNFSAALHVCRRKLEYTLAYPSIIEAHTCIISHSPENCTQNFCLCIARACSQASAAAVNIKEHLTVEVHFVWS